MSEPATDRARRLTGALNGAAAAGSGQPVARTGRLMPFVDVYLGASLAGRSGRLSPLPPQESGQAVAHELERLAPFWNDGYLDSLEVIVLAHRLGVIDGHPRQLFGQSRERLRAALVPLPPGALPCEVGAFRIALDARLVVLRKDEQQLEAYLRFLESVWAALEPAQCAGGLTRTLAGVSIADLPSTHVARAIPAVRAELARYAASKIVMVESMLVPSSGLYVLLPDIAVVGRCTDQGRWLGAAHAMSAAIARQYQVLSDPTRVMILARLARRERSVTQLAAELHMTQPNATRQVKILCDAGLLQSHREGKLIYYHAPESALAELLAVAARDLAALARW